MTARGGGMGREREKKENKESERKGERVQNGGEGAWTNFS
jgi:hypothetical protein